MSRKKQFKAESKRLLDLMINSIYTNKEIFLREIISNASDAIDKRYYKSASAGKSGLSRNDYSIRIEADKDNRTLTISDNGIGMSEKELDENLGIIANSGSLDFKQGITPAVKTGKKSSADVSSDLVNEDASNDSSDSNLPDIIGQFGVGFYSAFMVSKRIEVISLAEDEEKAYSWTSDGASGYRIEESDREEVGTTIILTLRDDNDEPDGENYSKYLEEMTIKRLIAKYSDYIRYPIVMSVEKSREKPATEEEKNADGYEPTYETFFEDEILNSMVPIWKKKKSEISKDDYNEFYKSKFYDMSDPLKVIHTKVEGVISYDALLFIPSEVPFNYYTKDYKHGLQLYSSGVMIMDNCEDLLPQYFGFVKGLVDSQDLSLNISREMLQQDRQLKAIAQRIEKKISQSLNEMLTNDRDNYNKFFKAFGIQLKFGVYDYFGMNKDKLKDLIMFQSSLANELSTIKEYISRMPSEQKYIYYATGESVAKLEAMPHMDIFKDKGYEVFFCTDEVDEFALKILGEYEGKEFKNIGDNDLGFDISDEEKEKSDKKNEDAKKVLDAVKDALGEKVTSVILSNRLKEHPVCLSTSNGISLEMTKILKAQAEVTGNSGMADFNADVVLEINGNLPFYGNLEKAVSDGDEDRIKDYAMLLYDQALLIEGLPIEDSVEFSKRICRLM